MARWDVKILSSLEKCFIDEDLSAHPATESFSGFRGERLSFQVAVYNPSRENGVVRPKVVKCGTLKKYVTLGQVTSVPSAFPAKLNREIDPYDLRTQPGLFPDPILPLHYAGKINVAPMQTAVVWVNVEIPADFPAGDYTAGIRLTLPDGTREAEATAQIHVVGATLPEQKLIHTEWFYTDCLAEAYYVRPFSTEHWKIIERFMKTAVESGVNAILTPVFTPELDTYIGGERLTTQLVKITVDERGYTYDFSDLEKWVAMCQKLGVKYFEIPHFYTQWGSKHAPKIVAKVNGRTKKIFGWETDAQGDEYRAFLSSFIPALIGFFREKGLDHNCLFHVSDEPKPRDLDTYRECSKFLRGFLSGYTVIDAMSDVEIYRSGAIENPVPHIGKIAPFLKEDIADRWAYYCGTSPDISHRSFAAPLYFTRIIGVQLWKMHIKGLLHWGYNYYHNQYSYDYVDPFGETSGEYFEVSGDAFLVYPGHDKKPCESIRLCAMRDAVADYRALDYLESLRGREYVEKLLDRLAGCDLSFTEFPHDAAFFAALTETLAAEIETALSEKR